MNRIWTGRERSGDIGRLGMALVLWFSGRVRGDLPLGGELEKKRTWDLGETSRRSSRL